MTPGAPTRLGRLGRAIYHRGAARCAIDPVLGAVCALLLIYYIATPGIFQGKASGDGMLGFLYLPGIFIHHTLDLGVPGPEWGPIYGRERTGHVANPCPIGPVLFWAPAYLVALGLKKLSFLLLGLPHRYVPAAVRAYLMMKFPGPPTMRAGPTYDYFMAGLAPLFWGMAGLFLLFRLLRRRVSLGAARFGVVGAVLGTPLCWYMVNQPLYQHATSFFTVALFLERWDAWRAGQGRGAEAPAADGPPLTRWIALGALAGLMMAVRLQEGIWLLLPGLDVMAGMWGGSPGFAGRGGRSESGAPPDRPRRRPAEAARWLLCGLVFLLAAAVVFSPQVLVWRYFYGHLRPPQPPGHMRWTSPAIVETLFSMRAGLFPWMPVLYIALPGLVLGRRQVGALWWRLLLLFCLELYVNASVWDYHGSWGYGPRRFVGATAIFGVGLAGAWAAAEALRRPAARAWALRGLAVALAVMVAWNLFLTEMLRRRRIKNSAVGAFTAEVWVRWADGPKWLERGFGRFGYPFAWPAAWVYGWIYHMPATSFEGIVGNYLLERDWHVRSYVLTPGFAFNDVWRYTVSGLLAPPPGGWPPGAPVPAGPEVRVLIPLAAREPVRFTVTGEFGGKEAQVRVRWNGTAVPVVARKGLISVTVPEALVHTRARLNEVRIEDLPPGSRLGRMDFQSLVVWWAH